ncbi:MAG: hypothetical protein RIR62_1694 [Pseudomonadota bacterium]|jgi:hypothetical protein
MSKHIADRRAPSKGGRVRAFMKIARHPREGWHRSEGTPTNRRVVEFLRIARGRSA